MATEQSDFHAASFDAGWVAAVKTVSDAVAEYGDLSPFLEAYFDTTTGPKREPSSYQRIAAALQLLFVSDAEAELDAARSAHRRTTHSLRPGITPPPKPSHSAIHTFDEL
jgi:enolase-phosphatase E1